MLKTDSHPHYPSFKGMGCVSHENNNYTFSLIAKVPIIFEFHSISPDVRIIRTQFKMDDPTGFMAPPKLNANILSISCLFLRYGRTFIADMERKKAISVNLLPFDKLQFYFRKILGSGPYRAITLCLTDVLDLC